MKKRMLSFFLIIILCISNVGSIYAAENLQDVTSTDELEEEITTYLNNDEDSYEAPRGSSAQIEELASSLEEDSDEAITEEVELVEISSEVLLDSTWENYSVDKTAPYTGNYLIMTNNKKLSTDIDEKIGILPDVLDYDEYALQEWEEPTEQEVVNDYDVDKEFIMACDTEVCELEGDEYLPVPDFNEDEVCLQSAEDVALEATTLGSERVFNLRTKSDLKFYPEDCVCVAVGEHAVVWVPKNDPIYVNNPANMRDYMGQVCAEFDSKYNNITSYFGGIQYSDYYGDRDGKVALICYDYAGDAATNPNGAFTSGYFTGADLNVNFTNKTGNNIDCLHLDSWQAMGRNGLKLTNISYSYETMVHEFQHMIMWSNMRKIEAKGGKIDFKLNVPSWINEGYSEAVVHLCYGESTGRVSRYNQGASKGGQLSILDWTGDRTSYALVYIFFQYVRTQYAQKTADGGWGIYYNAISKLSSTGTDPATEEGAKLLDAIAAEIGVSSEDLIENFWTALFMLNAEGPYGFGGEQWAEKIQPLVTDKPANTLKPGASQVVAITGPFTPSGYDSDIVFAGLDKTIKTGEKEKITITGRNTLTTLGDTLQLTATSTAYKPAKVKWSIPNIDDREIVSVSESGVVTALSHGTAVVRASSAYDMTAYAEITITAQYDANKDLKLTKTLENTAYGQKTLYLKSEKTNAAKIYYTTDGSAATKYDKEFPTSGINFTEIGETTINILAIADGYYKATAKEEVKIEKVKTPKIDVRILTDGSFGVAMSSETPDCDIMFTLDDSSPITNGRKYPNREFKEFADNMTSIHAVARKKGSIDSDIAEYVFDSFPRVSDFEIISTPVYDGYKVEVKSKDTKTEFRYTFDGKTPTKSSGIFPKNGFTLKKEGKTTFMVKGYKAGCIPVLRVYEIDTKRLDEPVIKKEYIGYLNSFKISVEDVPTNNGGTVIYYMVDDATEGIAYTKPFVVDADKAHTIKAYVMKKGYYQSKKATSVIDKITPEYRRLTVLPRTPSATVTLNRQSAEISEIIPLVPIDGEDIRHCTIDGPNAAAFEIKNIKDDDWKLSLKDTSIKNASYKLSLLMRGTDYPDEPAQVLKLTVKLVDKKPAVTIKKATVQKYFPEKTVPLTVTSKDGRVEIVGLEDKVAGFKNNYTLVDSSGDGHFDSISLKKKYGELTKDAKGKPIDAGYLKVNIDGYSTQLVPITVSINTALPKLAQTTASPKVNYDAFASDGYKTSVSYTIVNSQGVKVLLRKIDKVAIDKSSASYAKVASLLDNMTPVSVDSNGNITIKYNLASGTAISGAQNVPIIISGQTSDGYFYDVPVIAKFSIDKPTVAVKTTLKPSTLKLNKQMNDHAYTDVITNQTNVAIKEMVCNAVPSNGKNNLDELVKLRYDKTTKRLEAYFDGYSGPNSINCTSYKFECVPVYESLYDGKEVAGTQVIAVTVNIDNKAASLGTTQKGSVNVFDRKNTSIRYTIKKTNFNAEYDLDKTGQTIIGIESPSTLGKNELDGSKVFELKGNVIPQFEENSFVEIRLKDGVEVKKGQKYVFRIKILLENGAYAYTGNLKVAPTQPAVKCVQAKVPVIFKNVNVRSRSTTLAISSSPGELKKLTADTVKNAKLPAGLKYEISTTDVGKIKVTLLDNSVKPGNYTIYLNATYKDQMVEANGVPKNFPTSVKVSIKEK